MRFGEVEVVVKRWEVLGRFREKMLYLEDGEWSSEVGIGVEYNCGRGG